MIESTDTFTSWIAADGSNKDWPYDFTILVAGDAYLQYKDGADGEITETQLDVGFFPSAEFESGYLRYPLSTAALTNTHFVRVVRRLAYKQEADLGSQGSFNAQIHERAFDRLTMMVQQLDSDLDRVAKVPLGETAGETLPGSEGNLARWGADGGLGDAGFTAEEVEGWSTDAQAAAAAAALSEASATADAATVAADKATVAADKATVAADKAIVAADKAQVVTDAAEVSADKAIVLGYRDEVEADRVAVQADKVIASDAADTAVAAQTAAEAARDAALAAYDDFDDRYLGAKAADPVTDNDGNALAAGMLYFNTTASEMRIYTGSAWVAAYVSGGSYLQVAQNLADLNSAATARTNLDVYSTTQIDGMPGSVASKTTPIDADSWSIWDSVANAWRRVTGTNLKAYLKTYFDTVYTRATLGLATSDSPQFTGIELGHATDTTLSRGAAGFMAIEGKRVPSPASQAAGDILYRGSTEWERLPKGTAGQVLKMNAGATAPEWGTSTVDYGAGNAALSYGAVGTYVFAVAVQDTGVTANGTIAGSALKPAGIFSASATPGDDTAGTVADLVKGGSVLSGTWRVMGQSNASSTGDDTFGTLFLRIS